MGIHAEEMQENTIRPDFKVDLDMNRNLMQRSEKMVHTLTLLISFTLLMAGCTQTNENKEDWPEYNGGPDRNHFSLLTQINAENVSKLRKPGNITLAEQIQSKTKHKSNVIPLSSMEFYTESRQTHRHLPLMPPMESNFGERILRIQPSP